MRRYRRRRSERGVILVLAAILLVVLLGAASLAVDAGVLHVHKQAAVNGCDAAALGGAQAYLKSIGTSSTQKQADATSAATQIASANGLSNPITVSVTYPVSTQIKVQSSETVPLLFAKVFGINTSNVGAFAIASFATPNMISPGNGGGGLRPLGVDAGCMDQVTYGQSITIKLTQHNTNGTFKKTPDPCSPTSGNFLPMDLGGNGGNSYSTDLQNGSSSTFQVGQVIQTLPGNKQGPTNSAMTGIIAAANQPPFSSQVFGSTTNPVTPNNPRVFTIPIVDWTDAKSGKADVKILGFAMFYVDNTDGSGNITGRFMDFAQALGGSYNPGVPAGGDYHSYIVQLIA